MTDCTFCKIVDGKLPATVTYQDEQVTAFRDIHPAAPTHTLIVPNKHIASTNDAGPEDQALSDHMLTTVKMVADKEGIKKSGYRLIINTGTDANQVTHHLRLHVMGGRRMRHPMG